MADHPWSAGEARWIRPFLRLQTDDPNGAGMTNPAWTNRTGRPDRYPPSNPLPGLDPGVFQAIVQPVPFIYAHIKNTNH